MPIAARSPKRATGGLAHAPVARSRSRSTSTPIAAPAKACRACRAFCNATAPGHLPLPPRTRPHRARDQARIPARLSVGKVPRTSVRRALRHQDAAVRHAAARPRTSAPLRRHHAQGARRGLRGRHPLLGPRPLAGRCGRRRCRVDAREMASALDRFAEIFGEPPHAHGAAGWQMNVHALAADAAARASTTARTRAARIRFIPIWHAEIDRLPAAPDDPADAGRTDRRRRHHRGQRRRAPAERTARAARPPDTSTRCTPNSKAEARRPSSKQLLDRLEGARASSWDSVRALRDAIEPLAAARAARSAPGTASEAARARLLCRARSS